MNDIQKRFNNILLGIIEGQGEGRGKSNRNT